MGLSQTELPAPRVATVPVERLRTWPAVLTLFIFAALIPESIASANTPPLTWVLDPLVGLFMMAFYGSANLLIRELRVRRGLGWPGVLLLGAVFGFANEGIIAVTWFHVIPTDGYILQNGVDWAWAAGLTAFHAIFSVVVPIAFVEVLFPRIAARSWLSRRSTVAFAVLFVLTTAAGFGPATYRVNQWPVLAAMIVLTTVALALPPAKARAISTRRTPKLWPLRLYGVLAAFLFFFVLYGVPNIFGRHADLQTLRGLQVDYIAILAVYCALCVVVARRWTGRAGWGPPQVLALLTGGLVPSLVISLFASARLQPLLTVPFFLWLVWLAWRVKQPSAQTEAVAAH